MNKEEFFLAVVAFLYLPLYIVPLLIFCEVIGMLFSCIFLYIFLCIRDYIVLIPYMISDKKKEKILKSIAYCLNNNNIEKAVNIYFNQNDTTLRTRIINEFPALATQENYNKEKYWWTRLSMIIKNPSLATQKNYDNVNQLLYYDYMKYYKEVYQEKVFMLMENKSLATQENYDKEIEEDIKRRMVELNKNIIY